MVPKSGGNVAAVHASRAVPARGAQHVGDGDGYDTGVWWGLLGPAGISPDVLAKLSHDFVAALNTAAVKERLAKLGAQRDRQHAASIKAAGMKAE